MKQKALELLIAGPAIAVLGYEGGLYCINLVFVSVLPFLGRYLWVNNPFRDSLSSSKLRKV